MHRSIPLAITTVVALAPAAGAAAAASHSYRGTSTTMHWGVVQVTIGVTAKRVTTITATHPTDRARSQVINARAIPTLRSEALKAQSARIHLVSGATLTSQAFDTSLAAALHAAHLG
jgi:uncharacterized protein with FMN-binding domain